MISNSIIIFTDGSSRGNPGPGGFAAIIIFSEENNNRSEIKDLRFKIQEIGGREEMTTNNRMELVATIKALEVIKGLTLSLEKGRTFVYTDSSYLVNGITKWIYGWQKNGWKTKIKEPVENQDLWQKLSDLTTIYRSKIDWKLIGGHVGLAGNERCDQIATAFADNFKPNLYDGSLEKYPIKNILDLSYDTSKKNQKSENRKRSNAKAYSYISSVDGVIKIHKTWAECEQRVKGKKAKYKKAISPDEEMAIIKLFSV